MESKEQNSNKENKIVETHNKIDNTLTKGKQIVESVKNGVESINDTTNNLKNTLTKAGELVGSVKELKNTYLESKIIEANTQKGLAKIRSNHQNVNRIITEEYGKQKQSMDKSSDVVDAGLESNDLDKIKAGLDAMTKVANHNPMEKIKNQLDEDLEKSIKQDLDSDDFMLDF